MKDDSDNPTDTWSVLPWLGIRWVIMATGAVVFVFLDSMLRSEGSFSLQLGLELILLGTWVYA